MSDKYRTLLVVLGREGLDEENRYSGCLNLEIGPGANELQIMG